ncbi:ferritin-like domain-containing protein [Flavihumibacter petaseus]|uniref:Ferritin-like domain-containing protein n=1 Tax=Flavihumibacter petaseus NBRC 106054 TaxID=1220578 RepID=A0A0E9N721_9BACT|nr:ferritin-like domain-containing protein [Flavihumibacter petaseus]GAO45742.1 hypothetical protein FPE01S_18_00050 [Flavihumibacter petaseus NBRC 106054]
MNFTGIIQYWIGKDPAALDRIDSRRKVMREFCSTTAKLVATTLPFTLGALFNKAYGQSNTQITDVLNYALTLEYLESEFYKSGLDAGVVPAGTPAENAIKTIRDHEMAHVSFLSTVLQSMNVTPVTKPDFDFTAGGTFSDVFTNYDTFLAVAQTFEDTGVRAYKGSAGDLISNNTVLTATLQIHSVEARHASHIRQMRKARGTLLKPWVTGNDIGGVGAAVQFSYDGEENVVQGGVDISALVSDNSATEAFDEPLGPDQIMAILSPFFIP